MPESTLTERAVYIARPAITIDGQANDRVNELLLSMEMREREGGMCSLELTLSNVVSVPFGDAESAFEDGSVLKLGARIAVSAGDESASTPIFTGKITAMEGVFTEDSAPELVVFAEDAFQQARMTRRTKRHDNATVASLATDLASKVGLTPQVTGLSANIGVQVQLNESDLAFLQRMLARHDGQMWVKGNDMHVAPRGDVREGAIELELPGQLRRARVMADLAHQVTALTVTGWDPAQGQRVKGRSTGANPGPGSGREGKSLLSEALGDREEHVGNLVATDNDEAQALADAAFDHAARQFVRVDAMAEGNPALRVGTHVTLAGLGPRFGNEYYVTSATHRYDNEQGYITCFEAQSAFWLKG